MNTAKPSVLSSKILYRISGRGLGNEREKPIRTFPNVRLDAHRTFLDKLAMFDFEAGIWELVGVWSQCAVDFSSKRSNLMYLNLFYNVFETFLQCV